MATQKQSLPSFASILSVLSIVFYCAGFLRVELELNEQKKKINTLESVAETKPSFNIPDLIKLTKNVQEVQFSEHQRNRRFADSINNTKEAKSTADAMLKINALLSEGRLQLCQSTGDMCPPGPPGPPGPRGEKGSRGRRGQKGRTGNKGDRGIMGSPGKSGKQGIVGPTGLKGKTGIKGQKGDMGPAGIPGAKGEPGESISAPVVAVSPKKLTVNEGGSASFQCSVSGNPEPAIVWSKVDKQSTISQSAVSRGKLLLKNVAGSDSGTYNCLATNILGQAQGLVQLVVNGALSSSSILGSLDSKYLGKLNSYLDPVLQSSGRRRFVRCWHAKTAGWAASTFHSNCDGKGPTVTIVQVGSYIFGGFTDKSWGGSCRYISSSKSFLYSLYNINSYAPVKLMIKASRYSYAIYTCSDRGPAFGGGHDLWISNNAASNQQSHTYCGHYYPLPPGYSASGSSCRFYAGSYKFTPTDVEVFYETTT